QELCCNPYSSLFAGLGYLPYSLWSHSSRPGLSIGRRLSARRAAQRMQLKGSTSAWSISLLPPPLLIVGNDVVPRVVPISSSVELALILHHEKQDVRREGLRRISRSCRSYCAGRGVRAGARLPDSALP